MRDPDDKSIQPAPAWLPPRPAYSRPERRAVRRQTTAPAGVATLAAAALRRREPRKDRALNADPLL